MAALLAVCVIAGWKRGFVRSLMDLASNLIAIIVARIVSLRFAPYIFSAYFEQRAHDALKKELIFRRFRGNLRTLEGMTAETLIYRLKSVLTADELEKILKAAGGE